MNTNKNIVLLLISALITISLMSTSCCKLFPCKGPCASCPEKCKPSHHSKHDSECPFADFLMKAPCCAMKHKEKLSLTKDQQDKIKALCTKTKKDAIQLEADAEKIAVDIKGKFMEEIFDATGINSLIDKKFDLTKQLVKSCVNSHAQLLTILTDDQSTQLKEFMKECKGDCCGKDCGGCN